MNAVQTAFDRLKVSVGALDIEKRRRLLARLEASLIKRRDEIAQAVNADYGGRSSEETMIAELVVVVNAIRHARPRIKTWTKPRPMSVGAPFWPAKAWIAPQPLGIVGVLSPWNYPVQLALSPLVSALAAGNRILLKPSEITPRTADLLAALLDEALGPDIVQTVTGGPDVAAAVTRLPLDHLIFTGSTATGRKVMQAAAESLTPVTLELGGKCPAILMPDADLDHAARAIVTGKGINSGQTCIAPDTLLAVGRSLAEIQTALKAAWRRHYPNGPVTAIVSNRQSARFDELTKGATLDPLGPETDDPRRRPLALALDVKADSPLLNEEIFGPALPVLFLPSLDAAIQWIDARPSPLAIYLFTKDRAAESRVLAGTRSGALMVNGTLTYAAMEALPFGGVGASGFGRYHGEAGFDTFSNMRAHVRQTRFSLARLTEPPYDDRTRRLIARIFGKS